MSAFPSGASGPEVAHRDLQALPKVELHVHLEGSIAAPTAVDLARRHGEDPEQVLEVVRGDDGELGYPSPFRDFDHFVTTFLATTRQVRTPDDLATVAAAFARGQAAQGVRWTEATFTALTLVDNGMEPAAMWQALREGFAEVPDTRVGLIVDSVRNLGVEASHRTVALVEAADAPIVGLGLTGVEGSVPEREFAHLREAADTLGLGLAVHAGETGTPDNVRAALDELGAQRIGHGIAAAQDPSLLERLAREGVVLEVCPSSNVTLSIVPDLDAHPLPALWAADVPVTINSDDPPFFATTLSEELLIASRLLALTRRGLADLQRRAMRAAFAPADVRRQVLRQIDAWDAGWDV
ncbi:adenosine deaminase [Egicoccus halophilus]|uniref:Aminodeoxyfutalosine deaminase n=1 Tax=Egicoccus halophilus TaxID=1670830 RepID=A0A8J3EW44_9ACTN|nr:adenosine deaminase [Egicoccus halophilus]GGI09515.1 aminodeoxyfutalosine deaminase [Egicoccus halophilus]